MASWTKLQDGSWGIRCEQAVAVGDSVMVERRDGQQKRETIDSVVWTNGSVWVCTVAKKAKKKATPKAVITPSRLERRRWSTSHTYDLDDRFDWDRCGA